MKLREVHVDRYGPLRETLAFDSGATVVYGPNESGKTLLVESLLRSLTDSPSVAEARIDEDPEGYVVLGNGDEEWKLGPDELLFDHYERRYDFELTPAEFRNVFVVRDGDLAIADENSFYQRVTDRIVGIWTGDIQTVRDEVLARGRLTPLRMELSAQYDDADEQLDLARDLRADIAEYLDEAAEADLDALERDCYRARADLESAREEVDVLEAAEARQEYEELVKTKGVLEKSLEERAALPDADRLADLERRLENLDAGSEPELESRKTWYGRVTLAALAAGVFAGVAPVALGVTSLPALAAGPASFSLAALAALGLYRSASDDLATLAADREQLCEDASEAGIDAYDLADVRGAIAEVRDERESHTEVIQGNTEVLRTWLDIDATEPREVVAEAEDLLAARRAKVDLTVDREFTEEELEAARESAETARERYSERRERLRDHRRRLEEFADRAERLRFEAFVGDPLDLAVSNLDALEDLHERLDAFVAAIETDADVSRAAATVLAEMADSENEKMTTLFEDGTATDLFTAITGDRYTDLRLTGDSELVVELASGKTLSPADLSRGTRDQLYLAVRVALGRRLLEGRDGFFLMDDAFLSSDAQRLERQAEAVADLVDAGWQVVYLTCKRGARDQLVETADADLTELSPL